MILAARAAFALLFLVVALVAQPRGLAQGVGGVGTKTAPAAFGQIGPLNYLSIQTAALAAAMPASKYDLQPGFDVCAVILAGVSGTGHNVASLTDTSGNIYSLVVRATAPSSSYFTSEIWCSLTTNYLPAGSTWTASLGGGVGYTGAIVWHNATGGADQTATLINAQGTSASLSLPTLSQASEIVFGVANMSTGAGTWAESSGYVSTPNVMWPALPLTGGGTTVGNFGDVPMAVTTSTTAPTYAPSWTNSVFVTVALASFRQR